MRSLFLKQMKARTKGTLRRQRDLLFPDRTTRDYRAWMSAYSARRASCYDGSLKPGLLSIITAVWDGSPLPYLRQLSESISIQIKNAEAQWFILSNGCTNPQLLAYLQDIEARPFVSVHRLDHNAGIVTGLRQCLERASGRYVLPVDADDRLYPDALQVVTAHIQKNGYPPLLYSDEDKVSGTGIYQPYFKPDWDPVLLANSAYIAHLGIIDRQAALAVDGYGDKSAEGSADWDLFTRFANAGHAAIHVPEVLYSWRIHAQSTADDVASKPYIRSSQEAVLRRFLASQAAGSNFSVEANPLFGPTASHLRLTRRQVVAPWFQILKNPGSLYDLAAPAEALAHQNGFLGILGQDIEVDPAFADWHWDALGLFELFPDTTIVGGRISNHAGVIVEGPRYFGFGKLCGCPDAGRKIADPGYFGQMWKERTVSAISTRISLIRATDLLRILSTLPPEATLPHLGIWIAAHARRNGRRVVYSPFLHAIEKQPAQAPMSQVEEESFRASNADLIPDRRYYPQPFSLLHGYEIALPV